MTVFLFIQVENKIVFIWMHNGTKAFLKSHSYNPMILQVILFENDCAIFYTNLHELFCQFISSTNWVNCGKFMNNCWKSSYDEMKSVYNNLIIIDLYEIFFLPPNQEILIVQSKSYTNVTLQMLWPHWVLWFYVIVVY